MSNDTSISRRRFCGDACQVASCAALASVFSACSGSSSSPSAPANPGVPLGRSTGRFVGNTVQVTVSGSALTAVGGAVLVESNAGVFLVARTSDTAFSVVEGVCTHEGCTVTGADGATYVCPCHGSRYDRSGHVLAGPAKASLRQYASTFAGDTVTIPL